MIGQAERTSGGLATHRLIVLVDLGNAHGSQFGHLVGHREKSCHRPERLTIRVEIKPRDDDPPSSVCLGLQHVHDLVVKELHLVHSDDLPGHVEGVGSEKAFDVIHVLNGDRFQCAPNVGRQRILGVAVVNRGLHHEGELVRDLAPPQTPDQLL